MLLFLPGSLLESFHVAQISAKLLWVKSLKLHGPQGSQRQVYNNEKDEKRVWALNSENAGIDLQLTTSWSRNLPCSVMLL